MRLNIIVPVSRPENIRILRNVTISYHRNIVWWLVMDPACRPGMNAWPIGGIDVNIIWRNNGAIAGHAHRNVVMDILRIDGYNGDWIMSLDDDNVLHPEFIPWLSAHKDVMKDYNVVIFDQVMKDGTPRLTADPDNVKPNHIDTAQYMWRGLAAEGIRFREDLYNADGYFIEEVYQRNKDKTLFVNQPLCYYNYLRS